MQGYFGAKRRGDNGEESEKTEKAKKTEIQNETQRAKR